MAVLRHFIIPVLLVALLAAVSGCGAGESEEEAAWRQEVDSSLRGLKDARSFRYLTHLETWIGVSGQSVFGDETGEGLYRDGDFSVSITRTSPEGEERLELSSGDGGYYLREADAWSAIPPGSAPSPLHDPAVAVELASSYGSVSLQREEERSGVGCRRYLLRLESGRAREALTGAAWSYFSSLSFELSCTLWVCDASAPPVALQIEVVGSDPRESLQRYRTLASTDFSDFDSPDIQPASPSE
ncbi:MAG: hypothetical protein AB1384_03570 [Actinomycetota bacterium]